MITRIAHRLEEELKAKDGIAVESVSVNEEGNAIQIKVRNQFGCAVYIFRDELMIEMIVEQFVYGRSTD